MNFTVQYHAANPNLCRIPELRVRPMSECEGGGYYIPRDQAELIVDAIRLIASLRSIAGELWSKNETKHLYTVESIASSVVEQCDAILSRSTAA